MFGHAGGKGHQPMVAAIVPFNLAKPFHPFNAGTQIIKLGAGGPSGFVDGTAGAVKPWPYITGTKRFIQGFPFGTASSLAAIRPRPNVGTGVVKFIPIGYVKAQTGPVSTF